jgi:hypothetical protein
MVVNKEWTIQKHWQHWVSKTQDEDKQNKTIHHIKQIKLSNTDSIKKRGVDPGVREG